MYKNRARSGRSRKKVIRKRNCTIIVIPKKSKRSASFRSRSARRGKRWY